MEASTHEVAGPGVSASSDTAVSRASSDSDWLLLTTIFLVGALGYIGIGVGVYFLVTAL